GVALGVNPGLVERVLAVADLEEAGGLRVAGVADARHLQQLGAAAERPVLLAVLDQLAGRHGVQPGDVPQQGYAGRVQLDADVVDARLDDPLQRFLELPRVYVVLVQADADVLWVDLDQLAERVLQPTADGDRAPRERVEGRELLLGDRAGGILAGPRLV